MAAKLKTAMPPDQDLVGDYIVRLAALDPATGLAVAGVKVANVHMKVRNLAGTPLAASPFKPILLRAGG